jgi:hypothetical protein
VDVEDAVCSVCLETKVDCGNAILLCDGYDSLPFCASSHLTKCYQHFNSIFHLPSAHSRTFSSPDEPPQTLDLHTIDVGLLLVSSHTRIPCFSWSFLLAFSTGSCGVGVHQQCYGILELPEESEWLCDFCSALRVDTILAKMPRAAGAPPRKRRTGVSNVL